MSSSRWQENYATTNALDARHHAWERFGQVAGPFGLDVAPELPAGAAVLDAGCGNGIHLRRLIDSAPHASYHAIDASPAMVSATTARCPEALVDVGDVLALPWPQATFDAALCMHVLYHVPDQSQAIRELARVLKDSGWALVTTVAADGSDDCIALHNAACADAGLEAWSCDTWPAQRFNTTNGGQLLADAFAEVAFFPRTAALVYEYSADALAYYTSMDYFQQVARENPAAADSLYAAAEARINAAIAQDGALRIRKDCGTWLLQKPKR